MVDCQHSVIQQVPTIEAHFIVCGGLVSIRTDVESRPSILMAQACLRRAICQDASVNLLGLSMWEFQNPL